MGIYDRDYFQERNQRPRPPVRRGSDWSVITKIIIINVALFLANGLMTDDSALTRLLSLDSDTLLQPWLYWKFLTYGFAHSPSSIWHLAGNMLALFFLGYEVERRLGSQEFLRFYLATIIIGGILWSAMNLSTHAVCLGASGGVVGVVVLFAFYFPNRMLLLYGIIPIPAWLIGVIVVGFDILGAAGVGEQGIAFIVHLGGAAFAALYYNYGWNFGSMLSSLKRRFARNQSKRPQFGVFRPDDEPQRSTNPPFSSHDQPVSDFDRRVDEVLKKYSRVGEAGLTEEERKVLKDASKKYQEKWGGK
ncbi:MAG: rhomboid family intramembrane serine protease [Thermoguttaceae bacterium]